jgi:hypothetical protein
VVLLVLLLRRRGFHLTAALWHCRIHQMTHNGK